MNSLNVLPPHDFTVLEWIEAIILEYRRAALKHPAFRSPHEGKAIIEEEFDELWDEIKKRHPDMDAMTMEAIQVATMSLRFLVDCCSLKSYEAQQLLQKAA